MREYLTVWDLAHKQLNYHEKLLHGHTETCGSNLWALAETLDERSLSLGVLELDGLDLADVVQVASILIVAALLREGGLGDEAARLLVKIVLQVAPDDDVHRGCLADLVVAETGRLVVGKQGRLDGRQLAHFLVGDGSEVDSLCLHVVKSLARDVVHPKEDEIAEVFGLSWLSEKDLHFCCLHRRSTS